MGHLIILQLSPNQSLTSHHFRRIHINRLDGIKRKLTPSKLSHLVCLMSPRVFVREAGSAGLRKGLHGVMVVTILDRVAARPTAELPDSWIALWIHIYIYVIIFINHFKNKIQEPNSALHNKNQITKNATEWHLKTTQRHLCNEWALARKNPEDVWPLQQTVNQSKCLSFFCFGEKIWEASLISRGNRSLSESGTRKMDLGCEKPRLPRAALDSAIWRCHAPKAGKVRSTWAQLGNRFTPP